LDDIIKDIVDVIKNRAQRGLNYGVIVLAEGLIEHISNDIKGYLSEYDSSVLLDHSDDHGHYPLSSIRTEELLGKCIEIALKGSDVLFTPRYHFFGYEGRCSVPTRFDAWYCYHLGLTAAALVLGGHTGYMASLKDLDSGGVPVGIPLMDLFQTVSGTLSVIKQVPVSLDSPAFHYFQSRRDGWAKSDCFVSPGPIQLWGPLSSQLPLIVVLNQGYSSVSEY
jgi:pyrophosphate--fructose-6-phosphate 1-phosphotransferase